MDKPNLPYNVLQMPTVDDNGKYDGRVTTVMITSQAHATEINALLMQWIMMKQREQNKWVS